MTERSNDHWVKNDMMFICDGQGYCVNPRTGWSYCVGPVDDAGNRLKEKLGVTETLQNTPETPPSVKNDVAKLIKDTNHGEDNIQAQDGEGVLQHQGNKKHSGGRPRDGNSRWTRWRRRKEQQGALL